MTEPVEPTIDATPGRAVHTAVSWSVTGFLVALIVAVSWYAATRPELVPAPPPNKLASVQVLTVTPQPYREGLTLPAVLEAVRSATVSPEFGGKLARWLVAEGGAVEAGQVVAEFDTQALRASVAEVGARRRSAEAAVGQAQAAVAASQAALESARKEVSVRELGQKAAASAHELARTEHDRVEKLVGLKVLDAASFDTARNALTQAEVASAQAREGAEAARLGVKTAEAGVGEARARVDLARAAFGELDAAAATLEVQLGKAVLRAPVSGRLEEHLVEPGEFVGAGDPVARIYDLSRLRATVNVPDRYVAFLDPANPAASGYVARSRPGAVRELRVSVLVPGLPELARGEAADLELPARIARIAQAADPKSNTFAVELAVENPGGALRQGMIGRARIEYLTYPRAIVIPVAAVQMTDVGPRVLVVEGTGTGEVARVRDIVPASVSQDELLVLQGLVEGERLIVAGWKGLVAGEEVSVVVADGVFQAAGGGENGR